MRNAQSYAILPLRIVLGIVFIVHGQAKLWNLEGTAGFFSNLGIPLPAVFALAIGLLEFVGGIALLAGFVTRYAAGLLAINMLAALLLVHLKNGFVVSAQAVGYEFVLTLLAASLTIALAGAGPLSLDRGML